MNVGKVSASQNAADHPPQQRRSRSHRQDRPPPDSPLKPKSGAVVVGGGPAGVAAALALAKLRGWSDVNLVERLPDLKWYDPDRAYTYGLNPRGQAAMVKLGLEEAMKEAGVAQVGFSFTTVEASGKLVKQERRASALSTITYLMTRQDLMKMLAGGLEAHNMGAGTLGTKVKVLTNSRVIRLDRLKVKEGEGERLAVVVRKTIEGNEEDVVLYPGLVLGCDGINSIVRRTLQDWASEGHVEASGAWPPAHSFTLTKYPSPAAGLRFKVLRLPATMALKDGTVIENLCGFHLIGSYKGEWMRLSGFPIKDPGAERPGTIILRPDHPFWRIPHGDARAFRDAFQEAFPQIDINSMVSDDVMERFSKSEGGVFPEPSASNGLSFVMNPGVASRDYLSRCSMTSAVVLVGDAAHAFPPDLGQGVNAALQDVQALIQHLEETNDVVASAAAAYQDDRGPEALALAKLMSVGFPYMYNQAPLRGKVFQSMFMARVLLSNAVGAEIVPPPAAVLMRDASRRYSESLMLYVEGNKRIALGVIVGIFLGAIVAFAL